MLALVARQLGVAEFGIFAMAQSFAGIGGVIAAGGISAAALKYVGPLRFDEDGGKIRAYLEVTRSVTVRVLGALIAISLLISLISDGNVSRIALLSSLLLGPMGYELWREGVHRALGAVILAVLPRQAVAPLLTIVWIQWFGVASASEVMVILACAIAVCSLGSSFVLFNSIRRRVQGAHYEPGNSELEEWKKSAKIVGGTSLVQDLVARSDTAVVGIVAGPAMAGGYAVCVKIAQLTSIVLRANKLVFGRKLARDVNSSSSGNILGTLQRSAAFGAVVGLPFLLVTLFWAQEILLLFGDGYQAYAMPLFMLSIGYVFSLIVGPMGLALMFAGYETKLLKLSLLTGVSTVIAVAVGGGFFGAVGAAVSRSAGLIAQNIAYVVWTRRHMSEID